MSLRENNARLKWEIMNTRLILPGSGDTLYKKEKM